MAEHQPKREPIGSEEQLRRWVAGESVHDNEHDQCCPDFSCCNPELQAPPEVRRAFAAASSKQRSKLLFGFLGAAIAAAAPGEKVYIAGGDPEEEC